MNYDTESTGNEGHRQITQELTVYWQTMDRKTKERIRERFCMPNHTTINGETTCRIRSEDMNLLKECEKRGFIQIRNKP